MEIAHLFLKITKKICSWFLSYKNTNNANVINDPNTVEEILYNAIQSGKPFMASRFGAVEIGSVANYYSIKYQKHSIINYITDKQSEWWWNEGLRYCMMHNAGFFPNNNSNLEKFGELMLQDIKDIDILFSWQKKEQFFSEQLKNVIRVGFIWVDPFWSQKPWTRALAGKKVLVVHPFAKEIEDQYKNNREKVHASKDILPPFQLITIQSVQSIGGNSEFANWFEALEHMKQQIEKIDFDVCLIGCGAYGMPLAAHIKRMGRQAVHFGGSLQLLFGIRGKRWETSEYGRDYFTDRIGRYPELMNEYWIRPYSKSKFAGSEHVENGCYW